MIDNFGKIKEIFKLNDMKDGEFHTCVIWLRKKDIDGTSREGMIGSNNMQIKTFYINNEADLDKYERVIKDLCNNIGARAYFSSCTHSYEKAALKMIRDLGKMIMDLNYPGIKGLTSSSIMTSKIITKRRIIDIDVKEGAIIDDLKNLLGDNLVGVVPTIQGYHMICKPFDRYHMVQALNSYDVLPDIHKDNYCLLYCNL